MKKILLISLSLFAFCQVSAQWLGTNPVYFNSGFVGIGTSNPQGYLHVNPVRPVIIRNNGGNGVYGSEIGFNSVLNTAVVPNQFRKLGGTSQQGGANISVDYRGNMFFQMADAPNESENIINYNPQITFLNTGRVGIGTLSPETTLNIRQGAGDAVTGTASFRVGGTGNYPSLEFGIKGAYDGMISTYGNDLHVYAGNWRTAGAIASENHSISFYTSQSGSSNWNTAKMYLRWDGNLGIGTTTPDAKLAVKGTIHANEVKVDLLVPGPDYVFANDYQLQPLNELKTYIDQNKHLPEVPSAAAMEANGINLGEMNMILLKKVEELTLYVIELKKENEKTSSENSQMKAEIMNIKESIKAYEK